jgi:deazaflavin-dependent oxidoreductase (nitroreductase family)
MGSHANPQFLYLTTRGWKTSKQHRIEIWFVEHNNKYYIISERKNNAHWIKNILHNPKVSFNINSETQRGCARIVNNNENVSNLMNKKYGWSNGLIVELNPE